jgi:hypothetical protein
LAPANSSRRAAIRRLVAVGYVIRGAWPAARSCSTYVAALDIVLVLLVFKSDLRRDR